MLVRLPGCDAELPDNWADRSSFLFVMPADPALSQGPSIRQQAGSQANVGITFDAGQAGSREAVELRLRELSAVLPQFELVGRGMLEAGPTPTPYLEYRFTRSVRLQQITIARSLGDRTAFVVGTSITSLFPEMRARFVEVAKSLRPLA